MGVREIERSLERWELGVKDLQRRMILAPTPRERERWYAMLLLAQGWTAAATAEALDRDPHTIGRWASAFGEGGSGALIFEQTGGPPPPPLTGVGMGFLRWDMTRISRLSLGSGQGSGSSQTRLQRRPLISNRRSQSIPWRITLTVRAGRLQGSR